MRRSWSRPPLHWECWRLPVKRVMPALFGVWCLLLACSVPSAALADYRTIKVGLYENPPKVFTSESGKPSGIFVDILEEIAAGEGWRIRWIAGTWADGLERLERGELDLMPDVAFTSERARIYTFHKIPVISPWFQVYAHQGSDIHSIFDLNGKNIAVLRGSVQEAAFRSLAQGFGVSIFLVTAPDYDSVFQLVVDGEADAAIANQFFGTMNARRFNLEDTAVIFSPSDLFFAAPKDASSQLLDAIDARLAQFKSDPASIYYASLKRWTSEEPHFRMPVWLQLLALAFALALLIGWLNAWYWKRELNNRTRQLSESEVKYRTLFETAGDAIFLIKDDKAIDCNLRTLSLFHCKREEIVGESPYRFAPPQQPDGSPSKEKALGKIAATLQDGAQEFEWTHQRLDGSVFEAEVNLSRLELQGESLVLAIVRDISSRKQAERELQKYAQEMEQRVQARTAQLAARNQELKEFAYTVSHDLKAPLRGIAGYADELSRKHREGLTQRALFCLTQILTATSHLEHLIEDLLHYSRLEAETLSVSKVDLGKLLSSLLQDRDLTLKEMHMQVTTEIPDPMVCTWERGLIQIVTNLMDNAIKYSRNSEHPQMHIQMVKGESSWVLSVADNGIGFDMKYHDRIFGLFNRLVRMEEFEGTGAGLAIVKKVVDKLGGRIWAQSKPGEGATFFVELPLEGLVQER